MHWLKKGCVFAPSEESKWMTTSAMVPIPFRRESCHRVYFGGRDESGRSQIGYFDFDVTDPGHIINTSRQPVLSLGSLGTFDDNGVTTSCLVDHRNGLYLYYGGWTRGLTVPFYAYVGLAISVDGGESFERVSRAPILERNDIDPFLTMSPAVLIEGGIWRMWYVSCVKWDSNNDRIKHYYHIKYAESRDGIHWKRSGLICIDFKSADEYAISRPCVRKEDDIYKMWYSSRGKNYRIGYAESGDGLEWIRKDDEAGIDVSASGWDSEMIAYPYVFDHEGHKYMLYNGNGYGATGIGLAVLAGS